MTRPQIQSKFLQSGGSVAQGTPSLPPVSDITPKIYNSAKLSRWARWLSSVVNGDICGPGHVSSVCCKMGEAQPWQPAWHRVGVYFPFSVSAGMWHTPRAGATA